MRHICLEVKATDKDAAEKEAAALQAAMAKVGIGHIAPEPYRDPRQKVFVCRLHGYYVGKASIEQMIERVKVAAAKKRKAG